MEGANGVPTLRIPAGLEWSASATRNSPTVAEGGGCAQKTYAHRGALKGEFVIREQT